MTRAARTARGAFGATAATLLAAASHGAAGGTITPLAIIATALVALPLCVALAGRVASPVRLTLAVVASQFLYHWSFWSLGATEGVAATHAHAALLPVFEPTAVVAQHSTGMWLSHSVAALLTIALLHRGERAGAALARLILRALPVAMPRAAALPRTPAAPMRFVDVALRECLTALSAISHRGPPAPLAAARAHAR